MAAFTVVARPAGALHATHPAELQGMRFPGRIAVLCALTLAGCSKRGPPPGTERGPCYGNGTCNAGLTCYSDLCVATTAAGPATSALMAKVEK